MKASERLAELTKALGRLDQALAVAGTDELYRDGTIQRFEFTFELAWKCLQTVLADQLSFTTGSPRAALRQAFQADIVQDETLWIALLEDRNRTTNTYGEELAAAFFSRIPRYRDELHRLVDYLVTLHPPE